MPMGDSITEGLCDTSRNCSVPELILPTAGAGLGACSWSLNPVNPGEAGYREPLRAKLAEQGIIATFVGSVQIAEGLAHEGHSGWKIEDLDYCVEKADWLEQAKPDVILLHIGTNDMGWGREPERMADDLRQLLEQIYAKVPKSTRTIIAQVIPTQSGLRNFYVALPAPANEILAEYNALIPGLVTEMQAAGYNVDYVDMWPAIQSDADFDWAGVHPTTGAANRMADIWLTKIAEIVKR
jgi:lysophospholipase L1-like esterase